MDVEAEAEVEVETSGDCLMQSIEKHTSICGETVQFRLGEEGKRLHFLDECGYRHSE